MNNEFIIDGTAFIRKEIYSSKNTEYFLVMSLKVMNPDVKVGYQPREDEAKLKIPISEEHYNRVMDALTLHPERSKTLGLIGKLELKLTS